MLNLKSPNHAVLLFFLVSAFLPHSSMAMETSRKLALGATYGGAQVHWGLAKKWALELRILKGKESGYEGDISASVIGVRGYRYFRAPSRLRFYAGVEGATTHSNSSTTDYKAHGTAFGGFGGTEIYLMKRLSVGVDVGPYMLSSRVKNSATSDGEMSIVINSYMNFYLL